MGYYSQVVIAINPEVYDNAPQEVKESFDCIFFAPTVRDEKRIVFHSESIKFYDVAEGDHSVSLIEDWLGTLDYKDFGLIILGEDEFDVTMDGDGYLYGLGYKREVTF